MFPEPRAVPTLQQDQCVVTEETSKLKAGKEEKTDQMAKKDDMGIL